MKFLVISRPRENRPGMTSAMVEATVEKGKRQLKSGVIDCLYSFADGSGTVGIANAESGDGLVDELDYPASPFVHFEVYPLASFDKVIGNLIATMKKQGL